MNWKDIFCELDNQLIIIALCVMSVLLIFYYTGDASNILSSIAGGLCGALSANRSKDGAAK